jgi:hypothetical protein
VLKQLPHTYYETSTKHKKCKNRPDNTPFIKINKFDIDISNKKTKNKCVKI